MICQDCGATMTDGEEMCWLCQGRPATETAAGEPSHSERSVYLGVAAAVVLVGVGAALSTPGLLLLGLVVALPALVRAYMVRAGSPGGPAAVRWAGSLSVLMAVLLAVTAGFLTACGAFRFR